MTRTLCPDVFYEELQPVAFYLDHVLVIHNPHIYMTLI